MVYTKQLNVDMCLSDNPQSKECAEKLRPQIQANLDGIVLKAAVLLSRAEL